MQREPHAPMGHEPVDEDGAVPSSVIRFGTVVGGGVVAAIASSLPAELRIGDGGSVFRAFEQWLALAALLTPIGILAVAVFRRGRVGLKIVAGERAPLIAASLLWWAVLELGILSAFGAVLRAKTHHHGLAGVTFAIFALISGLVIGLLAVRGVRMLLRMPPSGHRVALGVAAGATFLAIVLVGVRTARAEGIHTAGVLVDALALIVSSAIASTRVVAKQRLLAVIGVPVAAAILLLGLATVRAEPDLKELLSEAAPLHAWILGLLGR
ncbi:MAG: hypothetical protein KF819_04015 [Labilithrix sp.]|nr:hypothetical protein [Labilithrix sp.]